MKQTVQTLQAMKERGEKIAMLTCYDYTTAKLMDEAGMDMLLVGDSLGNVILGYSDTISVTMEDMIHHTAAVSRGVQNAMVVADMPFLSYQTSVYDAVVNAGRLMKEGRAGAVKLEGGKLVCEQIRAIVNASIPVVAHLGMTPQSVNTLGGFKVQGKTADARCQSGRGSRSLCISHGVCAGKAGCIGHQDTAYSHNWHWCRSRLRRTGTGISGHAGHVLGLPSEVCPEICRSRKSDADSIPIGPQ